VLDYIWIIPALPLVGVILNLFLGYRLGRRFVHVVGSGVVGLAFLAAVAAWLALLDLPAAERHVVQNLFTWLPVGDLRVEAALLLDPLSTVMILVVTGVGFLIHVYSTGYMAHDESYARFFAYLNLFTASMLILVLAANFLLLYVGWELVGLCSYLLIAFWFTRKAAADAGKKAFIVNRVGDFGFAIGVFLIFVTFGRLDYSTVFAAADQVFKTATLDLGGFVVPTATAIALLLFIGATGKSAQLPLYVWLPDAMEGPTPVSALIHAATMVTAGVYLVARAHVIFSHSPAAMLVVATVGALTALYAASIGLVQTDIKRVFAYSTISQLGYMFLGVGVGVYAAGIFHLVTHAFFKALLFLGAGSVMHALAGETDLGKMGGLKERMKWTTWTMVIAGIAIAGIPPFAGFFSKDEILAGAFRAGQPVLWAIGAITAAMTAFYVFRALFLAFWGQPRHPHRAEQAHESPASMVIPLAVLAGLSAVGGLLLGPWVGNPFEHFLAPVFADSHVAAAVDAPESLLIAISVVMGLLGLGVAYLTYVRGTISATAWANRLSLPYKILIHKYWVDEIYVAVIVNPLKWLAGVLADVVDTLIIDGAANGLARLIALVGDSLRQLQTGYVRHYALSILVGAVLVLVYLLLK